MVTVRLNVGCGPHYADGWCNTDLIRAGDVQPDLVVDADLPFLFPLGSVERAYCGHVLEHVPWSQVPDWLNLLADVLAPDAPVCFVGPDYRRALALWKEDREPWGKVAAIIEGTGSYIEASGSWAPLRWAADRHHWNCDEARVVELLTDLGWRDVAPVPLVGDRLDETALRDAGWPLVDGSPCQFAVTARRPA